MNSFHKYFENGHCYIHGIAAFASAPGSGSIPLRPRPLRPQLNALNHRPSTMLSYLVATQPARIYQVKLRGL